MLRFVPIALVVAIAVGSTPAVSAQDHDPFKQEIAKIDITFSESSWHDTLVARKTRDDKTPVLATVSVAGKVYENVQVRYKGNSSFHGSLKEGLDKLPFRLKAAKGTKFDGGYDQIRLSNNFRDPSAIREILAYEIAGTYVPVPRCVPAVLTVNDKYVGVYTITEGMSDRMIEEYFCNTDGTLVKCEPHFRMSQPAGCPKGEFANLAYLGSNAECYKALYDVESGKEIETIMELTRYLKNSSDPGKYVDTHHALWMHALNNVLVNLDSYLGIFCHNYYVYKDEHGKFYPLIWDLNLAFGAFATIDNQVTPDPATLSPMAHDKYLSGRRPLIEEMTSERIDRRTYFYMITAIVNDWFANDRYLEEATRLQEVIRPYYDQEETQLYPISDFDKSITATVKRGDNRSIPGIGELMSARTVYLQQHPLLNKPRPIVTDYGVTTLDEGSSIMVRTSDDVTEAYLYVKADECSAWKEVVLEKVDETKWISEPTPITEFYVLVSNDSAVSMAPAQAPGKTWFIE